MDNTERARELINKHLYLHGGDGLGITDGDVYRAVLDAVSEALTIPVVLGQSEQLPILERCECEEPNMDDEPVLADSLKSLSVEIPLRDYLDAGYRVNIGDRVNLKYWLRTFHDDDYRTVTIEDVEQRNNIEYCGEEHYICLDVFPKAVFNFR